MNSRRACDVPDDEARVARVISSRGSAKVVQARAGRRASLTQVDGRRWLTLEGSTRVDLGSLGHEDRSRPGGLA